MLKRQISLSGAKENCIALRFRFGLLKHLQALPKVFCGILATVSAATIPTLRLHIPVQEIIA